MTPPDSVPFPEMVLSHAGWMRRLARSLVRDDAQADDVVQEAVVAAIRHPPRDTVALPAWLATTVRNRARNLWRGESRMAAREERAAKKEALPSTAEVVARAEVHGVVVKHVLALEEPYKTALLLRFFDDLPPRDVAERTGVPVETARARIRRGLEQLRARLDAAHGGDGSAWKLALVPLAFPTGAAVGGAGAGAGSGAGTGAAAGHPITTGAMVMTGTGATTAVGVVALAAGVAAGWWCSASKADAVALQLSASIDEQRAEIAALRTEVAERDARAKRQADESEVRLRAAHRDASDVRRQLEERTADLDAARAAAALAAMPSLARTSVPAPAKGPRFAFPEYAKLDEVDWPSLGEHLAAISPLVEDIGKSVAKGEEPTPESQGKATQHTGALLTAALKVAGQVPGTSVNSSFVHPAFMVNAIAATLDAAGMPLTDEESTALESLARRMTDEDVRRLQAYPPQTFALQKTIEETALRGRFLDAAFAALTPEQQKALTPPSTRGLVGLDSFTEGLAFLQFVLPVRFRDMDALVDVVSNAARTRLKLPANQIDAVKGVVARWARDLPTALVDPASGLGPRSGVVKSSTLTTEASLTLSLVQSLASDLKLEGASAEAARKWQAVFLLAPSDDA